MTIDLKSMTRKELEKLRVDVDRVQHWVGQGAGLSDRVSQLVKEAAAQA